MIDSYYRGVFQRWCVEPIARRALLHPHIITSLSLVAGLLSALSLAYDQRLIALSLLALSGYCDVLDGSIARARGVSSELGAALDLVSDRAVEFALVLGFYLRNPSCGLLTFVMFGSMYLCIASFFSVSIFSRGDSEKSFVYSPGLVERTETFLCFALMTALPAFYFQLALLYTGAVFLTTAIRLWEFFCAKSS